MEKEKESAAGEKRKLYSVSSSNKFGYMVCSAKTASSTSSLTHATSGSSWPLRGTRLTRFGRSCGQCLGLRQMFVGSCWALCWSSPPRAWAQSGLSHFKPIRSTHRFSMAKDTINSRLLVALNGVGTALYDPRPAVAKFLFIRQAGPKRRSVSVR